jgi:hypothetical protein
MHGCCSSTNHIWGQELAQWVLILVFTVLVVAIMVVISRQQWVKQ